MSNSPASQGCSLNNCQFCDLAMDCVFLAILQKVEKLENELEKMAVQPARQY
ncbi:hypothetical protein ACFLXY_05810 [Chloroflexota bacterium]